MQSSHASKPKIEPIPEEGKLCTGADEKEGMLTSKPSSQNGGAVNPGGKAESATENSASRNGGGGSNNDSNPVILSPSCTSPREGEFGEIKRNFADTNSVTRSSSCGSIRKLRPETTSMAGQATNQRGCNSGSRASSMSPRSNHHAHQERRSSKRMSTWAKVHVGVSAHHSSSSKSDDIKSAISSTSEAQLPRRFCEVLAPYCLKDLESKLQVHIKALHEVFPPPPSSIDGGGGVGSGNEESNDDDSLTRNNLTRHLRFTFNCETASDTAKSIKNYKKAQSLRQKYQCAKIQRKLLEEGLDRCASQAFFPHSKKILRLFPHICNFCTDKYDRPVAFVPLRHLRIYEMMSEIADEEYFAYEMYRWEYMSQLLMSISARTKMLAQWVIIVDMQKFPTSIFSRKGMNYLRKPHLVLNQIFKELLGPIIVINAPPVFQAIWGIAKYFVTSRTRKKVSVYGRDFEAKLSELISAKNVRRLVKETMTQADRSFGSDSSKDLKTADA
mmetsp:Transcript_18035/g.29859  ORF Transcript_18035/g.29859 Transcript_18035/m.29859 type:complete len:500 (-) Transcript_18035:39-1538(-)